MQNIGRFLWEKKMVKNYSKQFELQPSPYEGHSDQIAFNTKWFISIYAFSSNPPVLKKPRKNNTTDNKISYDFFDLRR